MNDSETLQNGEAPKEKVLPIFYKKKVFPLEKTKHLEKEMQKLRYSNKQQVENKKAMLDKIRERDDKFVASLESYLERFQRVNVEEIVLQEDMFPQWSPQKKDIEPETASLPSKFDVDDALQRLDEWYDTMNTYVDGQREAVEGIIGDWFNALDKYGNEGESDPKALQYSTIQQIDSLEDFVDPLNVLYYFIFILLCVVNVFIFYQPEDVKKCANEPGECIINGTTYFLDRLSDSYLAFHNMSLMTIMPAMPVATAALNSSIQ